MSGDDHPYRTRADLPCPRCGVPLSRYGERDKWRCKQCVGVLLGELELTVEAPWLLDAPKSVVKHPQPPCPACSVAMDPIMFDDIELDRCTKDKIVWFDAAELGLVIELARAEMEREAELTQIEQQAPLALLSRILADDDEPAKS